MLLLTGPPGCGKAATVHVLAKEMKLFVKEWINPLDFRFYDSIDDEQRGIYDAKKLCFGHRSTW